MRGADAVEERTWTVRTVTLLSAAGGGTSEVEGGVPGPRAGGRPCLRPPLRPSLAGFPPSQGRSPPVRTEPLHRLHRLHFHLPEAFPRPCPLLRGTGRRLHEETGRRGRAGPPRGCGSLQRRAGHPEPSKDRKKRGDPHRLR